MARLISVNAGLPRDIAWRGQTVHTAIWKTPADRRVMVRRLNIAGDGQGDLAGHGGEHREVMAYQLDSYRYWDRHLRRNDFMQNRRLSHLRMRADRRRRRIPTRSIGTGRQRQRACLLLAAKHGYRVGPLEAKVPVGAFR